MQINFTFDTEKPLSEKESEGLIHLLTGHTLSQWLDGEHGIQTLTRVTEELDLPAPAAVAKKATPAPAAKAPAKKAAAAPAAAPEPEPEPAVEEPAPEELEAPEEDAAGVTLEDAVTAATELVGQGKTAVVKAALTAVGAKRVSEIKPELVADFLAALEG